MPNTTTCKLLPTPGNSACDFKATAGDSVTLEVKEVTGGGLIDFEVGTKYAGKEIPGTPGKTITFTVVAGSNDLVLIYLFSRPSDGHGELHEVCAQNPFLDYARASNKSPTYTICA
jgi:hypothetical protein